VIKREKNCECKREKGELRKKERERRERERDSESLKTFFLSLLTTHNVP